MDKNPFLSQLPSEGSASSAMSSKKTQKATFRHIAGLWKGRVQLRTQADVNRALKRLRGSTQRRLRRWVKIECG